MAQFKTKARFFVDESLGEGTVETLRGLKWNVKGVWEADLIGRSDEEVFAFARKDDRILLSHDTDFLDDTRFPLYRQPGVFVLPGADGDTAVLVEALAKVVNVFVAIPELCRHAKVHVYEKQHFTIKTRDAANGKTVTQRYRMGNPDRVWIWRE